MDNNRLYYPTSLMVSLTDQCSLNCYDGKYCFRGNKPDNKNWIDESKLERVFGEAVEAGLMYLCFVSSEPFLRIDLLERTIQKATKAGLKVAYFPTTGFFGNTYERAVEYFKRIQDAGFSLDGLGTDIRHANFGIDFSIDMFHSNVNPEHAATAVLAYLDVFGPTNAIAIKVTKPAPEYDDDTNIMKALEVFAKSGKIKDIDVGEKEIIFQDGSNVKIVNFTLMRTGNALRLHPRMARRKEFSLEDLTYCLGFHIRAPRPYHNLYVSPTLDAYPELEWVNAWHAGNLAEVSVQEAIDNVEDNPLTPLFMSMGARGLFELMKDMDADLGNLMGSQTCEICSRYISDDILMENVKAWIKHTKLDEQLKEHLREPITQIRKKIEESITRR